MYSLVLIDGAAMIAYSSSPTYGSMLSAIMETENIT